MRKNLKFQTRLPSPTAQAVGGQVSNLKSSRSGFTLIELMIYLAIVSIMLVSISYLILDIIGGQTKSYAKSEVNQNLRFIANHLNKDIRSAQAIGSLTADTLILTLPGEDITYNFDSGSKNITRQLGGGEAVNLNSNQIEVAGTFIDLSYNSRSKNIEIHLNVNYKNPDNLPDHKASTSADFSVELRGRR